MPHRILRPRNAVDVSLTLSPLRSGRGDPTIVLARDEAWRATRTPDGPSSVHLLARSGEIDVQSWGPGASWSLETVPELLGLHDDPAAFHPRDPVLRDLHRRLPGLRLGRSNGVVEVLVPTIIQQKVTAIEAKQAYRRLVRRHGEPAPGPLKLSLPPAPDVLAALPYYEFHPLGIERKRAATVKVACSYARRLEDTVRLPPAEARRRLMSLPGIGPWTAATVETVALGNPDAVVTGDYHLPHIVCWVLAGEPRGDDARMLELLEPYRGQRARALRLLALARRRPPAFAPHQPLRSIERL